MHSMDIVAKKTIFVAPSKSCLVSGSSVGYHLCLQCRIPTVQYVQSVLDTHSAEHFSKFGCSNSLMLLTHRSQNFLISSERCEEPSTENILLELEQHKLVDSCCSVTNRQLSCAADTTPPHALQHTVLRMGWDRTRGYGYEVNNIGDMSHVADATAGSLIFDTSIIILLLGHCQKDLGQGSWSPNCNSNMRYN